jgi:hypothetical protein
MKNLHWLLGIGLMSFSVPSHAIPLQNGSFESGNFVPNSDNAMSLNVGATDIAGWTVQNAPLAWIGPSNPFGLTAADGSFFLDLSGYHDNAPYGGVLQTLIPTTIGALYRISFAVGTDPRYDSAAVGVLVSADSASGTFNSTPVNANQWDSFNFDFTATSANTSVSLVGQAATDQKYLGLDQVEMVLLRDPNGDPNGVPDSGGTLTLLVGSILLIWATRRQLCQD